MGSVQIPEAVWIQFGALILFMLFIAGAGKAVADFISRRDIDWRDYFNQIRASDSDSVAKLTGVIEKLVARMESMENKFDKHDATEMEILRNVVASQERKTQPRKPNGG